MTAAAVASVVVCTRNRATELAAMLRAVAATEVPADLPAEVVVVDNGSVDATREVVERWDAGPFARRYLVAPTPGVARARNAGLGAARGDVILFLDDDVRPPGRWLEPMCRPILDGVADAVAGGVRLAAHLERPWMRPLHRAWLADTSYLDPVAPREMVSANMALGRHVLARVPAFDPELGPGALGQGEDALFAWQLRCAGYRIVPALEVAVEHHFAPTRLARASFAATADRRGRTQAYLEHHWDHLDPGPLRRRTLVAWIRLALSRARHPTRRDEGMPVVEMRARERLAMLRHWSVERRRPRHYERHGLVKRDGVP